MDQLLQRATTENDADRKAAEAALTALRESDPEAFVRELMGTFSRRGTVPDASRQLALIVLKRQLHRVGEEEPLFRRLSPASQEALAQTMLAATPSEPSAQVRRAAADVIAVLGVFLLDDDDDDAGGGGGGTGAPLPLKWPALWVFLQQCVGSPEAHLNVVALTIFERLGEVIAGSRGCWPHFAGFNAVFVAKMGAENPMAVRLAAAHGAASLAMHAKGAQLGAMEPATVALLKLLAELASAAAVSGDAADATTVANVLGELTETSGAALLKPHFPHTVELLTAVAGEARLDRDLRATCLHALLNVMEHNSAHKVMTRKEPRVTALLLPRLLQMLTEWGEGAGGADELAAWDTQADEDNSGENDEGRMVEAAAESLFRLSRVIKWKKLGPSLEARLAELFASPAWEARCAAVAALACVCSVMPPEAALLQGFAAQFAASMATDPHPRVRAEVMDALGEFASDDGGHSPLLQITAHAHASRAIVAGLRDASARVRYAACYALGAFCNGMDQETAEDCLKPYLREVLGALIVAMQAAPTALHLERSMNTVTVVCEAGGELDGDTFAGVFGTMAPTLSAILTASDAENQARFCASGDAPAEKRLSNARELKGRALECLTVMGTTNEACKVLFRAQAPAMLAHIVAMLQGMASETAAQRGAGAAPAFNDNPTRSFCWDALSRLLPMLEVDVLEPTLPVVVPALLDVMEESMAVVSRDDDDPTGSRMTVHDSALEEKQAATSALYYLFDSFMSHAPLEKRHLLAPFAPRAHELLKELLCFHGSEVFNDLRRIAAGALPVVLAALATVVPPAELPAACAAVASFSAEPGAAGARPCAIDRAAFKPASVAQMYAKLLYVAVDVLGDCLVDEEDPPTAEMQRALLRQLKEVVHVGCARAAFPGGAPPAPPLVSPLLSGAARGAANFFPLLAPAVLLQAATATRGVLREALQRRALRDADARVTLCETLSRAFPALTEDACRAAAEAGGGVLARAAAAAAAAAGGAAPLPGVLDEELDEEAEEEAEAEEATDANLVHGAHEVWGALARTHGGAWIPVFNEVLGAEVAELGRPGRPLVDRRHFLFAFDDVLELCGEAAVDGSGAPWAAALLPQLCVDAAGSEPVLRQAAMYGLGVAAVSAPGHFAPHGGAALVALSACLDAYDRGALSEKRDAGYDNAVGALLRIAAACMPAGDPTRGAMVARALSALPLTADEGEGAFAARLLCEWLRNGDAQLQAALGLGGDAPRLAAVLGVLAAACAPGGLDADEDAQRSFVGSHGYAKFDRVSHHVAAALAHLESAAPALLAAAAPLVGDAAVALPRLQRVRANPDAKSFEGE